MANRILAAAAAAFLLVTAMSGPVLAYTDLSRTYPGYIHCLNSTDTPGTPGTVVSCGSGSSGGVAATTTQILTSSSATACTNIKATSGTLVSVVNASVNAQTQTVKFFNDAAAACAAATEVYEIILGPSQSVVLNIPLSAGWAYSLSGALTAGANVIVTY